MRVFGFDAALRGSIEGDFDFFEGWTFSPIDSIPLRFPSIENASAARGFGRGFGSWTRSSGSSHGKHGGEEGGLDERFASSEKMAFRGGLDDAAVSEPGGGLDSIVLSKVRYSHFGGVRRSHARRANIKVDAFRTSSPRRIRPAGHSPRHDQALRSIASSRIFNDVFFAAIYVDDVSLDCCITCPDAFVLLRPSPSVPPS